MPPQYVKAYVRRGKNDAADAAAICEAVSRPSMRFVPIKREEQQSHLMMHRGRDLLIRPNSGSSGYSPASARCFWPDDSAAPRDQRGIVPHQPGR
jgi:hypothetical protein